MHVRAIILHANRYSPALNNHLSAAERATTRATASAEMQQVMHVQSAKLSASESEDDIDDMDSKTASASAAVSEKEVRTALGTLRVEPADDEERAEKFKLYEQ